MRNRIRKLNVTAPPTSPLASTVPEADRLHLQFRFLSRRLGSADPAVLATLAALAFPTAEARS
jgi:hypothetical protein